MSSLRIWAFLHTHNMRYSTDNMSTLAKNKNSRKPHLVRCIVFIEDEMWSEWVVDSGQWWEIWERFTELQSFSLLLLLDGDLYWLSDWLMSNLLSFLSRKKKHLLWTALFFLLLAKFVVAPTVQALAAPPVTLILWKLQRYLKRWNRSWLSLISSLLDPSPLPGH
jgi:hypothetical protein